MRRILILLTLSFTLASSSAALAGPGSRGQLGERSSGAERLNQDYYMHRKIYRRDQNEIRDESGDKLGHQHQRPQDVPPIAFERHPSMIVTSDPSQGPR